MLESSSNEALVSSNEAACSLAPSANDWLAAEISAAAAFVCRAPADRASVACSMGRTMDFSNNRTTTTPRIRVTKPAISVAFDS